MQAVTQALSEGLSTFLGFIPQLIGALVILLVGYIVARVLRSVVARVLQGVGFDGWMERGGIKQFFDRSETTHTPATILGLLVFWAVMIIAITMATDALGVPQVSAVLAQLVAYIPQIIAAILILVLAALLANFVAGIVRGATGSNIMGSIAQYAIIVFAGFAALTQLGIAQELIAPTFLILLGAVALAAAIAFGLGSREVAQEVVQKAYNRSDEIKPEPSSTSGSATGGSHTGGSAQSGSSQSGSSTSGSATGGSAGRESAKDDMEGDGRSSVRRAGGR